MKHLKRYNEKIKKTYEGYELNKSVLLSDYLQTLFDEYDLEFCETICINGFIEYPKSQPNIDFWQYEWCENIGKCGIHILSSKGKCIEIADKIMTDIKNIESFLGSKIKLYKGKDDGEYYINISIMLPR